MHHQRQQNVMCTHQIDIICAIWLWFMPWPPILVRCDEFIQTKQLINRTSNYPRHNVHNELSSDVIDWKQARHVDVVATAVLTTSWLPCAAHLARLLYCMPICKLATYRVIVADDAFFIGWHYLAYHGIFFDHNHNYAVPRRTAPFVCVFTGRLDRFRDPKAALTDIYHSRDEQHF